MVPEQLSTIRTLLSTVDGSQSSEQAVEAERKNSIETMVSIEFLRPHPYEIIENYVAETSETLSSALQFPVVKNKTSTREK